MLDDRSAPFGQTRSNSLIFGHHHNAQNAPLPGMGFPPKPFTVLLPALRMVCVGPAIRQASIAVSRSSQLILLNWLCFSRWPGGGKPLAPTKNRHLPGFLVNTVADVEKVPTLPFIPVARFIREKPATMLNIPGKPGTRNGFFIRFQPNAPFLGCGFGGWLVLF